MNPRQAPSQRPPFLPTASMALAAGLLSACVHSKSSKHSHVLHESEPNDLACCPDHFGFLAPGEFVDIQGFISDDGFDPYDGFAFTSFQPMSVEFRLFAHEPFADLDICLYDPVLDLFVDCFESPHDPEVGVAHILTGGTEFHLVVNSFAGTSGYTLEVDAFPLFADAVGPADSPMPATGGVLSGGSAAEAKPDRLQDFEGYRQAPEPPASTTTVELTRTDPATGVTRTTSFAQASEGNVYWMGNPDGVDAE